MCGKLIFADIHYPLLRQVLPQHILDCLELDWKDIHDNPLLVSDFVKAQDFTEGQGLTDKVYCTRREIRMYPFKTQPTDILMRFSSGIVVCRQHDENRVYGSERPPCSSMHEIEEMIQNDQRVILSEISSDLRLSYGTMQHIISDVLRYSKTVLRKHPLRTWLNGQGPDFYQDGLSKLVLRSDNCLNRLGDYIEK
ncbi:hypothetical protein TNCV_1616461 [Trichonephila clavipes]|nr:hypothetical protein TNCV_1616461 [Trichonephila clavipes]